jgi:hypothetical protein
VAQLLAATPSPGGSGGYQWWYEKLSSRGHVVDKGWAVDNGGRSWSRQVNEVASDLAGWLGRRGHKVPIRTAVMIMHGQAVLGDLKTVAAFELYGLA